MRIRASILLVLFGAGLLIGCYTLREESIASGKRRAASESTLTESLVSIQARPTNSTPNRVAKAEGSNAGYATVNLTSTPWDGDPPVAWGK